jgi:hypothetical protein
LPAEYTSELSDFGDHAVAPKAIALEIITGGCTFVRVNRDIDEMPSCSLLALQPNLIGPGRNLRKRAGIFTREQITHLPCGFNYQVLFGNLRNNAVTFPTPPERVRD